MTKKKWVISFVVLLLLLWPGYLVYRYAKTRYVINDYFTQGRWETLKDRYDNYKLSGDFVILFGDSMTENFGAYLQKETIINMGISGDFSEGLIKRISNVTSHCPTKVFLMIGINDIIEQVSLAQIQDNYVELINLLKSGCPNTDILVQSTLPTEGLNGYFSSSKTHNEIVIALNSFLHTYCMKHGLEFIDMYPDFVDDNNLLKKSLSKDGVHLTKEGYDIWLGYLNKYLD